MLIPFEAKLPRVHPTAWIAETAVLIGDLEVGEESSIWYGCVVRGDESPIRIGRRTNIQDASVLHVLGGLYPCNIGDDVTVGHMAIVHGCEVADRVLIGMGAIVMSNVKVGEGAVIGSGAVVPEGKEIPPYTLWLGAPAKYVRQIREDERERFGQTSEAYRHLKDRYRGA